MASIVLKAAAVVVALVAPIEAFGGDDPSTSSVNGTLAPAGVPPPEKVAPNAATAPGVTAPKATPSPGAILPNPSATTPPAGNGSPPGVNKNPS